MSEASQTGGSPTVTVTPLSTVELVDGGGVNKAAVSAGGALKVDNSAVTQPVSSTTLATSAKQDSQTTLLAGGLPAALGAGGGIKVDGSGTALPVTANAGTNLNTSLLALEAGGNLAACVVELIDIEAQLVLPGALDGSGFLKIHEQGTATVAGTVTANFGTGPNVDGTALASAARTATATSASISNTFGSHVLVYLNITVASGTGGLQVRVLGIDPVSGNGFPLGAAPTAIIATGQYAIQVGNGCTSTGGAISSTSAVAAVVPKTFQIQVVHGDASSYTYSVGYSLVV